MPLLTIVIDDKSPLISYDATWLPGTSQDDNYAVDYYLGTFQKNNAADGTATFSFNATAFWIYGANRPNHGTYTIEVDNANYPNFNGSGNNLFQQSLFSANVSQEMHTIKLTNTGGTSGLYIDIDMIVWQSEVGNTNDQLVPELVQDVDPRFQYEQSVWGTTSASSNLNLNLFNNGTGHITETSDATVAFTFILTVLTGEAVTLFGTSGPSNGPYSVQLDGGQMMRYNASNAYPTNYGVAIYHADNLGPGAHQIILTNLPDTSGQFLTIDYAQLWTIANASTSPSPSVTPCVPSSNGIAQKLSSGVIAGLVVEGVVAFLAAIAAALFYWRWKTALASPPTFYTPLHRSPETTTATATGIAPSLETRSDPTTLRNNISIQPFAAVGRSPQQYDDDSGMQDNMLSHAASHPPDSRIAAEEVNSRDEVRELPRDRSVHNVFQRQALGRRPPQDEPGGLLQPAVVSGHTGFHRSDGQISGPDDTNELPPPGYDTAVRGTHV